MSKQSFIAAAIQMRAGADKAANVDAACSLVEQAARDGATLVVLPEMFAVYGSFSIIAPQAEAIPGPTSERMAGLARELGITLIAGSIPEVAAGGGKIHNTCLVFGPDGQLVGRYRKMHLPTLAIPGAAICESDYVAPGNEVSVVPSGVGRLGLAICYDLRFPELFRRIGEAQADVLALPSAFTQKTGEAHWHVLIRARAIENQMYVIAPNQRGQHEGTPDTYGHSLIVDPWGRVLGDAGEKETAIITAEIDLAAQREIRARLPALEHRRLKM